ncbi:MAG: tripartite tricarboxylate transporter permease [Clostridium sp.]
MIPLLVLGIPGDGVTAMMLGGFLIHGLSAGPLLFVKNADVVYGIFAACMLCTVIMLVVEWTCIEGLRSGVKGSEAHPASADPGSVLCRRVCDQ